ncbi:MAG: gamma-glutamyltransferase [Acidobacteria bacterium]|nr:MAG: gamma-glutamyltransferase [Acidobacteriota bacterium]
MEVIEPQRGGGGRRRGQQSDQSEHARSRQSRPDYHRRWPPRPASDRRGHEASTGRRPRRLRRRRRPLGGHRPGPRPQRDGGEPELPRHPGRHRSTVGRRKRGGCRGRDRLRPGRHPSRRGQRRRRRLPALPPAEGRGGRLRLPGDGTRGGQRDHVPPRRQVRQRHHNGYLSVGVPGTVAGLHMAWKAHGKLPWRRLLGPAITLAREGFMVTDGLARSLKEVLADMKSYPASIAQFSRAGQPYEMGDVLKQPDLARTLERIADKGPAGFYEGETAALVEKEMKAHGGLVTRADLAAYRAVRRAPVRGTYRGYEVLSMPPISSGGAALVEMLNVLEGYDLKERGFGGAAAVHVVAEAMRRAFADRARYMGDPAFNPGLAAVVERLTSKEYAQELRRTIRDDRASKSSPGAFSWPAESAQTTHVSVVDDARGAASLTYTLEEGYGAKIVVPGAGFLLNDEMGDFNAGPGLTDENGLIGTEPNLAAPGKRMLSSMTPAILSRDGELFMVVGSPGGRTIINTVLLTILNVVDFGMNVQQAIDAPRFHHQWLPDRIQYERFGLSPDTAALLRAKGHELRETDTQGVAQAIVYDAKNKVLEGGCDRRAPDGAAIGR